MNEIQIGRFSAILQKVLGIADRNPSGVIAPEIVPTLALETDRPEWAYLGGTRLCSGGAPFAAGGATQYGNVYLTNPVGSNCLAILEHVEVFARTTGYIPVYIGQVSTFVTSPSVGTFVSVTTDSRDPANKKISALQTSCKIEGDYTTGALTGVRTTHYMEQFQESAYFPGMKFECRHIITPGKQIGIGINIANIQWAFMLHWRERELGQLEA